MSQHPMASDRSTTSNGTLFKGVVLSLAVLLFFVVFGFWSGVPSGERALVFWIGVQLLAISLLSFSWLTWHLLFRPLPLGQTVRAQPISAASRQAMALLLSVGGFGFMVGAFWDEIWHRAYGIPFGEDFFWRPHLLIYFGILVAVALALFGLYRVLRWGQGTLQQRFRANPVIGLLILVGGLFMGVLPADPIWHAIYGEDLTAWSIPHVLLFISFAAILLLATAIHMTTQGRHAWGTPRQLRGADALPMVMFATLFLSWNQFFTTEWDGGARFVLARPEWLLPMLIVGGAAFIGVMANHTLRVFGAATLSGLLALALRVGLISLFDVETMMRFHAWVLVLPSLVLIDLWYAYRPGAAAGAGVAAAVGMGITLLTIFPRFYPLYPIANLRLAMVVALLASLMMSWLGATLGEYFAAGTTQEEDVAHMRLPLVSLGVAAATVAFILFFVTTATPPA